MAFVSLNQKQLLEKLSISNQVSPRRSEIDLFTFVKIEIEDQSLTLSSINSNIYYKSKILVDSNDSSSKLVFLVKTDILASSVALISDEKISLEVDLAKNTLVIQGSNSKHTLRIDTQNLADFIIPEKTEDTLQATVRVLASDLVKANKASLISVGEAKTVYQPEFLNICYTLKPTTNQLVIVSTDRYRITKNILTANYSELSEDLSNDNTNFLINPKNLQLLDLSSQYTESVELVFGQNYLWAEIGSNNLIMRYGEGKYPDYDKIIPQSFSCNFSVSTKDVLTSLKQVYLFAKTNLVNRSITLKIDPTEKKMILSAQTQDGFASESKVSIENYEGIQDSWTQLFNADYIIDYISSIDSSNVFWEANPGKPSVLSPENKKDNQLYLVSGLR